MDDPRQHALGPLADRRRLGVDGRIYAIGGADSSGNASAEVEPTTSRPTPGRSSRAFPRVGPPWALPGRRRPDLCDRRLAQRDHDEQRGHAYNPVTNTWTTLSSLPLDRQGLGVAAFANGQILAISGNHNNSGTLAAVGEVDALNVPAYGATASGLTVTGGVSLTVMAPITVAAGQTPTIILVGVVTGLAYEVANDRFSAQVSWGDGSTRPSASISLDRTCPCATSTPRNPPPTSWVVNTRSP